ncbi:50S ribosomal protein L35 [Ilyobacter sp.]|jgi:large subunit ribosomal protein L35|uniref:50S ribosomal protein L35 n=1 Tax=Ilyobacter sp. TaxID=3100343 RepID=UPI0029C68AD7|nr:50S ribosomal protein L35 [uncultured Ilyobacter sp.]
MPKMKTHKGTKKRVKITAKGKFVVKHSGTSHILTKKKRNKKNKLKKDFVAGEGSARKLRVLLPTGEGR